jgi:AcrR family transcriptional regulator
MEPQVAAPTPNEDPLREQLLDAAAAVFAEKGYFGAKIMDIVRASGLSSGAVYGRFASKDELLMEAVLSRVEKNAVGLRFQGKTVAEIVMATSRTDGALDDAEATQLEAFVAARREPKVAEAIAEARARWRETIGAPLAQQAIAEGVADPDADFDSIIYFLESLNLGLLVQRGAGQLPPDPEAWTRFLGRVIRSTGRITTKRDAPTTGGPAERAGGRS